MSEALNSTRNLLKSAFAAFNSHEIDALLALMHPDVDWANGMQGGRIRGHQEVREYWTQLWTSVDPQVTPIMFLGGETNPTMVVDIHQVIRDLSGSIIVEQVIQHVYSIRNGLIERMDIRSPDGKLSSGYL
jgi:hypothetical protein